MQPTPDIHSLDGRKARQTAKDQLTLPRHVVNAIGQPRHFETEIEDGRLVLTPGLPDGPAAVRCKLAALGLTDDDVRDAVVWAHGG